MSTYRLSYNDRASASQAAARDALEAVARGCGAPPARITSWSTGVPGMIGVEISFEAASDTSARKLSEVIAEDLRRDGLAAGEAMLHRRPPHGGRSTLVACIPS